MKRIIDFTKEEKKYIFKERDKNNKIEIDEKSKILNGLELYNQFFKSYSSKDTFQIIDGTTDEDKIDDKLCQPIYEKIRELFNSIENSIKEQLDSKEGNEEN